MPDSLIYLLCSQSEAFRLARLLNMNKFCREISINESELPKDRLVEVSRLALRKSFRRRKEDGIYAVESYLKQSEGGILPENPGDMTDQDRKRHQPAALF